MSSGDQAPPRAAFGWKVPPRGGGVALDMRVSAAIDSDPRVEVDRIRQDQTIAADYIGLEIPLMSVTDIQDEQSQAMPKDDLAPYAGQWVALRNGYVVAAAIDAVSLRSNPEVAGTDALLAVPRGSAAVLML